LEKKPKTHASPTNETYFTNIMLQDISNIKIWGWLFFKNLIYLHATLNEKKFKIK
jgi:hypothetical protein